MDSAKVSADCMVSSEAGLDFQRYPQLGQGGQTFICLHLSASHLMEAAPRKGAVLGGRGRLHRGQLPERTDHGAHPELREQFNLEGRAGWSHIHKRSSKWGLLPGLPLQVTSSARGYGLFFTGTAETILWVLNNLWFLQVLTNGQCSGCAQ